MIPELTSDEMIRLLNKLFTMASEIRIDPDTVVRDGEDFVQALAIWQVKMPPDGKWEGMAEVIAFRYRTFKDGSGAWTVA